MNYRTQFLTYLSKNLTAVISVLIIVQVLILLLFTSIEFLTYDKGIWFNVVNGMREGRIPYITTDEFILGPSEYPVLFTYFLLPFTLLPDSFYYFSLVFGLVQVFFTFLIVRTLVLLFNMRKEAPSKVLFLFLCPVFYLMSLSRFDLMPVGLLLLSYYYARKRNPYASGVILALASTLKLFPLVFVPSFFLIKKLDYKKFLLAFLITAFAIYIPVFILQPGTIFSPLSFVGSDYRPESLFGFLGFMNLAVPSWAASLIKYSIIALVLILAFKKVRSAVGFGFSLIILLMVSSPLFSPQWNIWIVPLLLLIGVCPLIIIVFEVITFIEFPFIWSKVAGLTGFTHERFFEGGVYSILFVLLNIARYAFLYYFFYQVIKKEGASFKFPKFLLRKKS